MNILIVNPFGIGDCLFTTPLIHTLKDKYPAGRIGFLCNKRVAPLLKANPFLDEIHIYERDDFARLASSARLKWAKEFGAFINSIKRGKFDIAVDLSLNTNFGFFLWLAGIKRRVGYNYKKRGFFLTDSIPLESYSDRHIVEYYGAILSLLGLDPKYKNPELYLNKEDNSYAEKILLDNKIRDIYPLIAVAAGGGASWGAQAYLKRWPEDKYARLIDKIIEKYKAQVIMLGDLSEKRSIGYIAGELNYKVIDLTGQLTLAQSAAVIAKSDLFIGNDGGLLHIAVALNKKTLSFFGPVDPRVYGPYPPEENRHVVLRRMLECSPCYRNFRLRECLRKRECLERIGVEEALEGVERLLNKSG